MSPQTEVDKADELSKLGAVYDGAMLAEVVASDAHECRQPFNDAILHTAKGDGLSVHTIVSYHSLPKTAHHK